MAVPPVSGLRSADRAESLKWGSAAIFERRAQRTASLIRVKSGLEWILSPR
jgi:hypothetical protein